MLFVFSLVFSLSLNAQVRQEISFDENWRFLKGDAPGAEKASFDDSQWRQRWVMEGSRSSFFKNSCSIALIMELASCKYFGVTERSSIFMAL
jgi:hypothetical protein